jgi:carboxyl-terminal processing protease
MSPMPRLVVSPLHNAALMRSAFLSLLLGLAFFVPAAPAAAQSGPRNCSITSQNMYVRAVLDQYYLWYQELPPANPADFESPEAYLEAVRSRPRDTSFSYITSRAANEAFYGDSQFVGLGISTQTGTDELRVLQVFPDSPASEAGLARGDHITEINGRRVQDLVSSGQIGTAFGESEIGVTIEIVVRAREGEPRRATLTKRVVTIPTVSLTRTFRVDGRTVGYLHFRNFVQPSYAALDDAFAALREAGVTELVIDVRYNGGGLVDVATYLASLVGGVVTEGRVFSEFRHNDKNTRLNETLRFRNPPQALTLSRLFVITTRASASASELIINGLRPHIPVVVIGGSTFGKPVGQYGFTFCDKVLAPVSFSLVNADGQGDYFDGIAPTCQAADDVEHDLGTAEEASLAEAFRYIQTGRCSTTTLTPESRTLRTRGAPERAYGWHSLVNAY